AAMDSGVATRPIQDFKQYRQRLIQFVFQTGFLMKPVFDQARGAPRRVVYAEGEAPVVLQAAQQAVDEGLAHPVLIGRPDAIRERCTELGLRLEPGRDVVVVNPGAEAVSPERVRCYCRATGAGEAEAERVLRDDATALAAVVLLTGGADALICGTSGTF